MLEGVPSLEALDLLGQMRLTALTRRLLTVLFAEKWMQADATVAHARLYFPDFVPVSDARDDDLAGESRPRTRASATTAAT